MLCVGGGIVSTFLEEKPLGLCFFVIGILCFVAGCMVTSLEWRAFRDTLRESGASDAEIQASWKQRHPPSGE